MGAARSDVLQIRVKPANSIKIVRQNAKSVNTNRTSMFPRPRMPAKSATNPNGRSDAPAIKLSRPRNPSPRQNFRPIRFAPKRLAKGTNATTRILMNPVNPAGLPHSSRTRYTPNRTQSANAAPKAIPIPRARACPKLSKATDKPPNGLEANNLKACHASFDAALTLSAATTAGLADACCFGKSA